MGMWPDFNFPSKKRKISNGPPPILKPDKKPPNPHGIGKSTWKRLGRQLDALFAIYIMDWKTKGNKYTKNRYFIKLDNNEWVSDMLPHYHNDLKLCYQGIEKLRLESIYINIQSNKDGYLVKSSNCKDTVFDKDLTFAIMASCLLSKKITKKEIQNAWDSQKK